MFNAIGMSVSTRHAGVSTVNLSSLDVATLQLMVLMMFLAPSPFVAVLESSKDWVSARRKLRHTLAAAATEQSERIANDGPPQDGGAARQWSEADVAKWTARKEEFLGRLLCVLLTVGADDDDDTGDGDAQKHDAATVTSLGSSMASKPENAEPTAVGGLVVEGAQTGDELHAAVEDSTWECDVDTHLLLSAKYPEGNPSRAVSARHHTMAVQHQIYKLWHHVRQSSPLLFNILFLWMMVQLALVGQALDPTSVETFDSNNNTVIDGTDGMIFPLLFELVSAFGNVGLSLGSSAYLEENACFSLDLNIFAQCLVLLTAVVGRTRGFPTRVDASMTLNWSTSAELLREVDAQDRYAPRSTTT